MERLKYYLYYLDSTFLGTAIIIRIVVLVVLILLFLYLISFFRLFIINNVINTNKFNDLKFQRKYGEKVREIVLSPTNMDTEEIKEKIHFNNNDIKKRWQKESLTKVMLLTKSDVAKKKKEINTNNYNEILNIFQLKYYWENEIATGKTRRKMRSLRKLEELSAEVVSGTITSLCHHRNQHLRKMARSEYVKFGEQDAFKYMEEEDFDQKFNRLDEIKLHDCLKQKSNKQGLPLLAQWVQNSKNEDYKCFLIREIAYFNQYESGPYLLDIFSETTSHKVQAEIARTLGLMKCEKALPLFTSQYKIHRLSTQANIVEAIGNIGEKDSIDFLLTVYEEAYNDDLKQKALEAIQKCGYKKSIFNEKLESVQYQK